MSHPGSEVRGTISMMGLPDHITTCLFDLDGVVIRTTHLHNAAWERTCNEFLARWTEAGGTPVAPSDPADDYRLHMDGKPRVDGVRCFLSSRGITLPFGSEDDPLGSDTLTGLGLRKHQLSRRLIREHGVEPYPGSVAYLAAALGQGLRVGLVTSSGDCEPLLAAAGLSDVFDVRIDARTAAREGLRGKPHPDTYLSGASRLGASAHETVVFEDAVVGVEAGRAGEFGYVVGVDRAGRPENLREVGADVVVSDLAELLASDTPSER
jgi:HAD superfamily hydrolase (TIGR01509 family)